MGIRDLYSILREHCPGVLVDTSMSEFTGYRVAVDISIFLNKFVKSAGPKRWLENFILLLCCLKKHGIKAVCIFDGPNPPIEKRKEQDRRKAEWLKKATKIQQLRDVLEYIQENCIPDDESEQIVPIDTDTRKKVMSLVSCARKVDTINYDDVHDVIDGLKSAIARHEKQNMPILPEYSQFARTIIECMGLAHMTAEGEAETLCSYLCVKGEVDAVLTEDTDVLAYGTPMFLAKIDMVKERMTVIQHDWMLASLGLDINEFRDMCILLGCDYNHRVKGYPPDGRKRKKPVSIGAKGAYSMIYEYRSLEEAEKYMTDSDPLNYIRCRKLFTVPDIIPGAVVPYNRPINQERLEKFIIDHGIRTPLSYILDTWKPAKLVFAKSKEESPTEHPAFNFEDES